MTVIIKRYRNRKLYNTQSKQYITLQQIEELIKVRNEVKVIDNSTGDDITATTLSQIIFELEKTRSGFLPASLLLSLVQSGGYRLEEIRQNIFDTLNLSHHFDVEIERRINQLVDNGDVSQAEGTQFLRKLLSVSSRQEELLENVENRFIEFLKKRQIPTKKDLQSLTLQIEHLMNKLEELNTENED
jgi:polyhydroxyalkanoate synthesis repressor PhaR